MKTVNEVSRLAGISVRTLYHYDAIGLLKPTGVTDAGYRLYDDAALARLQSILLFRELQFPLKEIKAILDNPRFDPDDALDRQIALLEMQRQRLDGIIAHAREIRRKGVNSMAFDAFDHREIDAYREEARSRWGETEAWREYEQKQRSGQDFQSAGQKLMALLGEIGALRALSPSAPEVQEKISELQSFITDHFYTCTDEILLGLGQMYTGDPRMQRSIDRAGGEGSAAFIRQAIEHLCKK